jgi:hypothetical protein
MFEIMKETFDKIGGISFITGMLLSVNKWLSQIDYSTPINILTLFSLAIGIVYFAMRMYHQYLETKKFKEEEKNEKD